MNRAQAAMAAHIARMKAANGVSVSYTRGAEVLTLTAWTGNTLFRRSQQETGAAVLWGERDYMIAAADLLLGGHLVTPAKGDRVTETIAGVAVTFEATAPKDEPVWRYSDQTRMVIRLHVKRV